VSSPARTRRRHQLRHILHCSDCLSTTAVEAGRVQVRHDPSCPAYRATGGGQPYREIVVIGQDLRATVAARYPLGGQS
jgi:hypothetical protein